MILILGETFIRLDVHILSMEYLEDETCCFNKVTKHKNINFERKVVEDEDGKEDSKEAITNLEKEANKKKAQCKA